MDYLVSRVASYLPGGNKVAMPKVLGRINVPINLYNSLMVVFHRTSRGRLAGDACFLRCLNLSIAWSQFKSMVLSNGAPRS